MLEPLASASTTDPSPLKNASVTIAQMTTLATSVKAATTQATKSGLTEDTYTDGGNGSPGNGSTTVTVGTEGSTWYDQAAQAPYIYMLVLYCIISFGVFSFWVINGRLDWKLNYRNSAQRSRGRVLRIDPFADFSGSHMHPGTSTLSLDYFDYFEEDLLSHGSTRSPPTYQHTEVVGQDTIETPTVHSEFTRDHRFEEWPGLSNAYDRQHRHLPEPRRARSLGPEPSLNRSRDRANTFDDLYERLRRLGYF